MKMGRNEPCWCRSGKKYKKCHLGRDEQPRVRRQDALEASRRTRRERTCFHPDASAESCGSVIGAHSVQRSGGGLAAIALKGHVYGHKLDLGGIDKTGGRVAPKLIGIGDASTFTGFCDRHDSQLFKPLEDDAFHATQEQLALLGFRALCRDLMAKRSALALNPFLKETGDRALPLLDQLMWQRRMLEHEGGNTLALIDLDHAADGLRDAIRSRDFSEIHALAYFFDRTPAMLASSPLTPEFDFEGRLLQDLNDQTITADVLTFSMIGDGDGGGAAVFSWIGEPPAVLSFISSLERISTEALPHRLVQFTLECFENAFWSPTWWDSLDESTRTSLTDRMNAQLDGARPSTHLKDDGTRSAQWAVSRVLRI